MAHHAKAYRTHKVFMLRLLSNETCNGLFAPHFSCEAIMNFATRFKAQWKLQKYQDSNVHGLC